MTQITQRDEMNEKVMSLAMQMLALPRVAADGGPVQVDLLHEHNLINGMYGRSLHIPAGVALTGLKHKSDHLNICIGDITVTTDDGLKRLTGVHVMETKAGMVRAGWAHSDTIWISVMRTQFESLEHLPAIEDEVTENADFLMTRRAALNSDTKGKLCQ